MQWVLQIVLQARRWLPKRFLVVVADSSYAVIELLWQLRQLKNPVCMITRFRLDAALHEPAKNRPSAKGRPRKKGKRLPTLETIALDKDTRWKRLTVQEWYGEKKRMIEITFKTAVWFHSGQPALPIRWVIVRDPKKIFKTQALLCTDPSITSSSHGASFRRPPCEGETMASKEQIAIIKQGVDVWNEWRRDHQDIEADLSDADLSGANLSGADLTKAHISRAKLRWVDLRHANLNLAELFRADLSDANISDAWLMGAHLVAASLIKAKLTKALLRNADFSQANLSQADLTGADLAGAQFVETQLSEAKISGCSVYAINVWDLKGEISEQKDLRITRNSQPAITVDNIEVAQFIYLVLNNEKLRDVINTITSKSVLILGRFTPSGRKEILNALRNKLRDYNLLPIVFDFDRPADRDFTETIKTLAGLSYFVIADVTNPKSSPLELQATVPDYQIPFVPIIQEGERPFAMMIDLQKKYNWVLPTRTYSSKEALIQKLKEGIIDPAMEKHNELRRIKAQKPDTVSLG